jgi:hypothetical protein
MGPKKAIVRLFRSLRIRDRSASLSRGRVAWDLPEARILLNRRPGAIVLFGSFMRCRGR